jgi:c-di-GMP-related signal transduction protein
MLDALVDQDLREVVAPLPLHEEIHEALIRHGGELGVQLEHVLAYERGDFERLPHSDPSPAAVREAYLAAVGWVMKMEKELAAIA